MMLGLASAPAAALASATIGAWADWIGAVSLQLVPLAIVVMLLDRMLRRAGPAVQSALWWMVIARLVLPPALALPIALMDAWPSLAANTNVSELEPGVLSRGAAAAATDAPVSAPMATLIVAVRSAVVGGVRALDTRILFALWLTGVVALACIARWRYQHVRRQCLDASSPAHDDVVQIARDAAARLGMRGVPAIRIANVARVAGGSGVEQPLVLGFLAPVVVLPASMLDRPRHELEHVLLHELAHVRRRDPAATLVCLIAQIVFWFHPAVWCARRRLATLREMACDRAVARVLGDGTSAYRRTLILLARSAAIAPAAGTIGLFQRRSALVTRLELLARPIQMRRSTECVVGVVLALGVLVSCMPRKAPAASAATVAAAAAAELSAIPPLDQLPGSLQKRYAVMRAIALTSAVQQEPEPR